MTTITTSTTTTPLGRRRDVPAWIALDNLVDERLQTRITATYDELRHAVEAFCTVLRDVRWTALEMLDVTDSIDLDDGRAVVWRATAFDDVQELLDLVELAVVEARGNELDERDRVTLEKLADRHLD